MRLILFQLLFLCVSLLLSSCGSAPPYEYRHVPGRTAILTPRGAMVPVDAPEAVKQAIAAGNHIAGKPYIYGGGHRSFDSKGYDCSGTASFLLHAAGVLSAPMASDEFRNFGSAGPGKWITIYAKRGHVFMSVAGLRMDTGWNGEREGPRWSTMSRPAKGCVLRHPPGL
ncbi:MAG: peptidoglycan endopeptidase [Verrucomicrobia bacterium]|nr:peptidoglycan endopeptidase [Verrucomicrobiota bacterium]